jgi:subtilisin family serine protease
MLDPPNFGFGITGVTPEASIYMYKVFSCILDATTDDLIMAGMMQAAGDGVNVIGLSLEVSIHFRMTLLTQLL